MIQKETIFAEYKLALSQCGLILPLWQWKHLPKELKLTRHKTKYGMADSDGVVYISEAFIGTSAFNKLRATLRHELAHLAVGIREGHNAKFKQCASRFGANRAIDRAEIEAVHANMPYKWQLQALLVDGRCIDLGGAHRRHKRYLSYPRHGRMMIDNVIVRRFNYLKLAAD